MQNMSASPVSIYGKYRGAPNFDNARLSYVYRPFFSPLILSKRSNNVAAIKQKICSRELLTLCHQSRNLSAIKKNLCNYKNTDGEGP